jgi:hypothetical protein
MRGHYFNILIFMFSFRCIIALINMDKHSCLADFSFTATNVKQTTECILVLTTRIEGHVLDTNAGNQLSSAATGVYTTLVLKKRTIFKHRLEL